MTGQLQRRARPLIAHVVHRFDVGGMENGVANLIEGLPAQFADHCVIALTRVAPSFARRVTRRDVRYVELDKPPGQTARILPKVLRTLRELRPAIVHTRNVATLEVQFAAWAAGVPVRIHGEHGWDVHDLDGTNLRMLWLRRLLRPLVHRQIALSNATERYLRERVLVHPERVVNICNGVDTERFRPAVNRVEARRGIFPQWPADAFVIGAVGRTATVKNLPMLLDAFALLAARDAEFRRRARLAIIGDGPALPEVRGRVAQLALTEHTWIAGQRDDVPECLRGLDLLCLPSLAEGISNTVLEAMASGIPVVATEVGGNPDLVEPGATGALVRSSDADACAAAIARYFAHPDELRTHGRNARARAVNEFSLERMISRYHRVYSEELRRAGWDAPSGAADARHSQSA